MGQRLDLQALLEEILGSRNVYFQPPSNIKMSYPAIIYSRTDINTLYAENLPYRLTRAYLVTLIDRNADNAIVDKVAALPLCSYDRFFTADDLNHDVFVLYY